MENHNSGSHYYQEDTDSVRQNRNQKYLLIIVLLIVGMLAAILVHINQYVQLSQKNLRLEQLKEKRNQLKTETAHLQLKISRLMSLKRIEQIATQRLNMNYPRKNNYVVLNCSSPQQNLSAKQTGSEIQEDRQDWWKNLSNQFSRLTNVQANKLDK